MGPFWKQLALICVIMVVVLSGCAEKEFDPADPAGSFATAKEPYDDENWDRAVTRLGEFKSRFPYSQYAVEAELLSANAQFELERYAEAAVAYSQFVKLHPKHAKLDFAMFRVGESYWSEAPEEVDREQEYTGKAVEEWETLIQKMPQSPYSKKAKEFVAEGKRRIAESFEFVSKFYCKLEIYHSCAYRYIQLAERYPKFVDLRNTALREAARALEYVADEKEKDPKSDKNIYFRDLSAVQIRAKAAELRTRATATR